MNTQVVRAPAPGPAPKLPRRGAFEALRPVLMAAALLAVLVAAALIAALVTGSGPPKNTFTLTVEPPTGGTLVGQGIECGTGGTSCSTSVIDGQVIELRAEADEGYTFAGYRLDCAPSGRLEMKAARRCGARFDSQGNSTKPGVPPLDGRRWALTLTPPENGTIVTMEGHECGPHKKVCTAEVLEGTIVSLEVMPEPGFRVQSYTGDCGDGTANMIKARSCGVVLVKGDGPGPERTTPAPPPGTADAPRTVRNDTRPGVNDARPPTPAAPSPPPPASVPPDKATEKAPSAAEGNSASSKPAPPVPPPTVAVPIGDKEAAEKLAQADIQRVLKAYRAAYERMDIPGMKRLQPGLNVKGHELQFGDVKWVKYTFGGDPQIEDLDVEIGRARAMVDLKTENEQKSGKIPKPLEGKATYLLKRIGEGKDWEIVEVRYAMKAK